MVIETKRGRAHTRTQGEFSFQLCRLNPPRESLPYSTLQESLLRRPLKDLKES